MTHYFGLLYAGLREYETARAHLGRGLSEARRLGDPNREAPLLGSIARVANLSRDYSRALTWALDAQRLAERVDSPPGRAYASPEQGRALLGLGQLQEARDVLEKGAAIAERIEQQGSLADFRAELARIASLEGRIADLSLVLLDVDNFKQVNDRHGHASGDAVLTAVAEVLKVALCGGTSLARWGGEEFAVLLPNVEREQAIDLAERLRQAVEELPLDQLPSVTISAGVASLGGRSLNRPDAIV